jgi:hypothetical protein
VWWLWVLGGLVVWSVLALAVAVVVGRGIRVADQHAAGAGDLTPADLPGWARPAGTRAARQRAVPLPPIGITLAAMAVALETSGFLLRLTGSTGATARLLSMDAPFSLPRLFVALLFAAAALAALTAAGGIPGRRTWWLAVALVGGVIASIKAGGTVHAEALSALVDSVGTGTATALSAAAAAGVVAALWFLSRHERRDRRRVLGALALYGVAAVGLSALSGAVGSTFAATATYVEESVEALGGVAFLIAVLVGVAPRLVLPASWALRRSADAHTLEVPETLPGRTAETR